MVWSYIRLVKAKFSSRLLEARPYNIKIIIVTLIMLQVQKNVIMQSYLVAFLICNHFRLHLDGRKIVKIGILKSRKMLIK